jgi:anti-anti-sigma factor
MPFMESAGFSVDVRDIAGVQDAVELTLHGPLDAKGVLPFKSQVESLTGRGVRHFVLHMEEVKYINSTGIAYLINLSESFEEDRGSVALVGVQAKVKIILDTMSVAQFFKLHANADAAIRDLKTLAPARPITRRREGSPAKTGRMSPPTDAPRANRPNAIGRFFRRLFGR